MGADIGVELGNTATSMISIGATAPRALAGVPSGAIRVAADFYGKASAFSFTISANQQQANLRTLALAAGWNGTSVVTATVNAGVYIWSDVTGIAALTIDGSWPNGVTLINNGYIIGKGGNGGSNLQQNVNTSIKPGGNGGSAMSLSINNLIIVNNSGAFIAGGGGGGGSGGFYSPSSVSWAGSGGGGAGGGSGGYTQNTFFVNAPGGNGGSVGTSGSDGTALEAATSIGSGGGGGRILPGTGGQGGFYGSVSSNQGFGRGGGAGGGGGQGCRQGFWQFQQGGPGGEQIPGCEASSPHAPAYEWFMTILDRFFALLGQVRIAVPATATVRHHRPGDPVAYGRKCTVLQAGYRPGAHSLDAANGFMAQNGGGLHFPLAVDGVQVATAQGGRLHPHHHLTLQRGGKWLFHQPEGQSRPVKQ